MKLALQIALGIVLATIILWAVILGVTVSMGKWAAQELEKEAAAAREQQEQAVAEAARVAAELFEREAERQRQEAEKRRVAAVRQQQAQEARQAREAEERRLVREFEAQYQPPRGCDNPQSNERWVECVDHRRNAKAAFLDQAALLGRLHEDIRIGD